MQGNHLTHTSLLFKVQATTRGVNYCLNHALISTKDQFRNLLFMEINALLKQKKWHVTILNMCTANKNHSKYVVVWYQTKCQNVLYHNIYLLQELLWNLH